MSKAIKYKVHGFTIKDIAVRTEWPKVEKAMRYHYKKVDKETYKRYREIFEEIKVSEWEGKSDPKERICVNCWSDFLEKDIPQFYSICTNKFSLSFRRWAELANIRIENATLDKNLREEILAHFLWEITYNGFHEKEIRKIGDELKRICNEVKSGKAKTVPFVSSEIIKNGKAKKTNSKVGAKAKRKRT